MGLLREAMHASHMASKVEDGFHPLGEGVAMLVWVPCCASYLVTLLPSLLGAEHRDLPSSSSLLSVGTT